MTYIFKVVFDSVMFKQMFFQNMTEVFSILSGEEFYYFLTLIGKYRREFYRNMKQKNNVARWLAIEESFRICISALMASVG